MTDPVNRPCADHLPDNARDGFAYDWEITPAILDTIDLNIGPQALLQPAVTAAVLTRALTKDSPLSGSMNPSGDA